MPLQRRNKPDAPLPIPLPNLNRTITPSRNEPPYNPLLLLLRTHQRPRRMRRAPTDRIDAHAVRMLQLVLPAVVLELQHADATVGRGAREHAADFVRGPGYHVYGGGV